MKALNSAILAFTVVLCLAPLCAVAQDVELKGLVGAPNQCALQSEANELCDTMAVFLTGEIELRGASRVESISVDADGIFSAKVPAGERVRVKLRRLRHRGARLNPRSYRVRPRTILVNGDTEPVYLMVTHRSQPAGSAPRIGY